MRLNKLIKLIVFSVKQYFANFKQHLFSMITIAISLLLFLIVAIAFDVNYANRVEQSYARIQDNYIGIVTNSREQFEAIHSAFSSANLISYSFVPSDAPVYTNGQELTIDLNVIITPQMYSGVSVYSGLDKFADAEISNSMAYETYELLCGRDFFCGNAEVIISEDFAGMLTQSPEESIGMEILLNSARDNSYHPATVVGVYKSLRTERKINALSQLNNGEIPANRSRYTFSAFIPTDSIFILPNTKERSYKDSTCYHYLFFSDSIERTYYESILTTLKSRDQLSSINVLSYDFIQSDISLEKNNSDFYKYLLMIIISIFSGISIMGTMLNTISSRKQEIGIKKALGASDFDILFGIVGESCINAIFSIVLSIALSFWIYIAYVFYERCINLNATIFKIYPSTIWVFLLYSFCVTIGFALIPAYHATQTNIIDVLRNE